MVTKIGIDLGYANITLSNAIADIYREPSVVLVDKNNRRILAIGIKAALGEEGDTVDSGVLVRPFKNGLLYSSDLTAEIINNVVDAVKPADRIKCLIGMPSDLLPKWPNGKYFQLCGSGMVCVATTEYSQYGVKVAISSVQSLSRVQLFATSWTAAYQASLSITNSQSSLDSRPLSQ